MYRIVSWSGENARSDVLLRERTGSLAVALKLVRWSLEDGAGTVTLYGGGFVRNYRSVAEVTDAARAAGVTSCK